ncbi:hemocyte protein-glutamine gamma-glutamyltransferase-like [Schistocerca americana]|uniref:hemocyte protein-glutamine gamma-glutamyltransferase-like n=1 Tax=Schistocerca americana TaxID=7009 RepID=UPI001F50124D|nr:hemocyte protein-glutamine gamma-glutamyltransferase-like [Schistocerca americana]XP_049949264.1 hemocyte protein-glutamine gamma-glutamyltransferase-like [Schistocerca serialis cubense]XP_049949266.1 hemocyte protein-glutamine gamma-glutamyltransferase-like [Schistocerca serialis cubense]
MPSVSISGGVGGRAPAAALLDDSERAFERGLVTRFSAEYEQRRRQEAAAATEADAAVADEAGEAPLVVELAEMYARDNARSHHTDQYELVQFGTPVLRRGLPFFVALRFTRPFDDAADVLRLQFNFGPQPSVTKGTCVILPVTQQQSLNDDKRLWDVKVHHQDGTTLTLQVQISTVAPVGVWRCVVQSSRADRRDVRRSYEHDTDVYVLFNPWCKEDQVHLEKEELRREYVLADTGKVWLGSARRPRGRRWVFGQFDDAVLPAVALLLERAALPHALRGDPVAVARAISAVVNSNDDRGLLWGRWRGPYAEGTAPHAWTGSVAILEQYLRSGGRPVRYGQCWVFAAATVTVCRALGLPCRSITNYVSAHDTNRSLTLDKYFTRDGEQMACGPGGCRPDVCWNFHVWNEVWMQRPDLPPGYGGWQVIDATPQEKSDERYRCGPASVEAVKRGEVGYQYDAPFVFSEVNADLCHFIEDNTSEWGFSRLSINQYHVGQRIVTKSAEKDDDEGDTDLEDITSQYKDPEGSHEERLAVLNAARFLPMARCHYELPSTENHDVAFDLVEIENVQLGHAFSVTVHIHNKAEEQRTITAILSACSVLYTGATAHRLKRANGEFIIQGGQREILRIQIMPQEYLDKLVDHNLVKIYAIASVKETRQTWSEEDDFPFINPKLSIQIRGSCQVGQTSQATFTFQNPLNRLLTDCTFTIEGPGLNRPKVIPFRDVKPGELVSFTETFRPRKVGDRKLVATFCSQQLPEVSGAATVSVQP